MYMCAPQSHIHFIIQSRYMVSVNISLLYSIVHYGDTRSITVITMISHVKHVFPTFKVFIALFTTDRHTANLCSVASIHHLPFTRGALVQPVPYSTYRPHTDQ